MGPMGKRSLASVRRSLAAGLKSGRQDRGLSQSDLAAKAGVRQALVSQIESAEANPTLETLCKLATALNVGIEALLAE